MKAHQASPGRGVCCCFHLLRSLGFAGQGGLHWALAHPSTPQSPWSRHPQCLVQNRAPSFVSITTMHHCSLEGLGFDPNLWHRLLFMATLVSTDLFSPSICSVVFPRDSMVAFHLGDLMVRTGLPRATLCGILFTFFYISACVITGRGILKVARCFFQGVSKEQIYFLLC